MADVHTFPDVHTTPAVDHRAPAFDKTKKGDFIKDKPPYKTNPVPDLAKRGIKTVKI
jgi:hypothetical protein